METIPRDKQFICPKCGEQLQEGVSTCPFCKHRIGKWEEDTLLNTQIRDYLVLKKLGQGGMGRTYLTRHTLLGSERVLKVMHPWVASHPDFPARFRTEARLLASLDHPAIVTLHEFSYLEDGTPFMVMEHLDGTTLSSFLAQKGALPLSMVLRFMNQVCQGLQCAHRAGIVHRDISPENILLVEAEEGVLNAKLIDFGIAKVNPPDTTADESTTGHGVVKTQTGIYIGKPGYGSPEQFRQLPEPFPIDARTDIFSTGIVFYEMVTGRDLFPKSNITAYLMALIRYYEQQQRFINWQDVPKRLKPIIEKCVAYHPKDRYPSMEMLSKDLEELSVDELTSVENAETEVLSQKEFRRESSVDELNKAKHSKRSVFTWGLVFLLVMIATYIVRIQFKQEPIVTPNSRRTPITIATQPSIEKTTETPVPQPTKSPLTLAEQEKITGLLMKLNESFAKKRYSVPLKDSVLDLGTQVLALDAQNTVVRQMFNEVIKYYREQAERSLKNGDFPALNQFLHKIDAFSPAVDLASEIDAYVAELQDKYQVIEKNGITYHLVPGGRFTFGSSPLEPGRYDDEGPAQKVFQPSFYMAETEMTNKYYLAFCRATGKSVPPQPGFAGMDDYFNHFPTYPVVNVNWFEAQSCAAYYGARLPTEREWERAARAGKDFMFPWGNTASPPANGGNLADESLHKWTSLITIFKGYNDRYTFTSPVKAFLPEGYGLFDLAGNVSEWCSDWYHKHALTDVKSSKGVDSGSGKKVIRGGSWNSPPRTVRCAYRKKEAPDSYYIQIGFRTAIDASIDEPLPSFILQSTEPAENKDLPSRADQTTNAQ